MKIKAEIVKMLLQNKEHQRLPANHQKLGRAAWKTDSPSQPSEETNPANNLILDL